MCVKNTYEKFFRGKEEEELYDLTTLKLDTFGFSYCLLNILLFNEVAMSLVNYGRCLLLSVYSL